MESARATSGPYMRRQRDWNRIVDGSDHGLKSSLAPRRRNWPDAIARRRYADPARQLVMSRVGELVRDGAAEWRLLGDDDVELRLASGEVFLLNERTVTRIA